MKMPKQRKWKQFYKAWYFWLFIAWGLITSYLPNLNKGYLFAEHIGILIGTFLFGLVAYSLFYFIGKLIRRKKEKP